MGLLGTLKSFEHHNKELRVFNELVLQHLPKVSKGFFSLLNIILKSWIFNIFDMLQFIADILFDVQTGPISARGGLL